MNKKFSDKPTTWCVHFEFKDGTSSDEFLPAPRARERFSFVIGTFAIYPSRVLRSVQLIDWMGRVYKSFQIHY